MSDYYRILSTPESTEFIITVFTGDFEEEEVVVEKKEKGRGGGGGVEKNLPSPRKRNGYGLRTTTVNPARSVSFTLLDEGGSIGIRVFTS